MGIWNSFKLSVRNIPRRLLDPSDCISDCPNEVAGLPIPEELHRLFQGGHWPRTERESREQESPSSAAICEWNVRAFASGETHIVLYRPPFPTVASVQKYEAIFWNNPIAASHEIDIDRSLLIGDFGLGSDAPIILDYRKDLKNPAVLRLKYAPYGKNNHWVVAADTFADFVRILDLWNVRFDRRRYL